VAWDGATPGDWQREIDGCDVVVNLAGRGVNCRYGAANREEFLRSRVQSTRVVGEAVARSVRPPRVWRDVTRRRLRQSPLLCRQPHDAGLTLRQAEIAGSRRVFVVNDPKPVEYLEQLVGVEHDP
jgi:hypothetical protein